MARPRPIIIPGPTGMGGKRRELNASIDPIAAINLFRLLAGKPTLQEEQKQKTAASEFDVLNKFLGNPVGEGQSLAPDTSAEVNVPGSQEARVVDPAQKAGMLKLFQDLAKSQIATSQQISEEERQSIRERGKTQEERGFEISKGEREFQQKKELEEIKAGNKTKDGQNYMLPGGEIVLSYDGGRTFADKSGKTVKIPSNSVRLPQATTLTEVRTQNLRQKAKDQTQGAPTSERGIDAEEAARGGTGPYANLKAAFDRLAGGLGFDAVFGKDGFYKDTQKHRQELRTLRQIGKTALINSPRFPVAEQEIVDKMFPNETVFWTNPATEANKFGPLRQIMKETLDFNNRAIAGGASSKEIEKLNESNREIKRFLNLIGEGKQAPLVGEGQTATNRETGERIIFKGGQWQPIR